ncbi:hypothetical protein AKJ35_00155 [candidate division MSBL1 archaeon SCGC-AAA833F18]|uniref:HTH cro/C1-type domain-containing protein n=1 Tax=candidate division MSBL1 archaeon SCGC-AAA833F18 TaxID=1698257 RepID=A0A133VTA8_9EURY|nr:hypothetical protein AKJ35_00155 [candidate division MSBL1 archaeon SCGC-AAA833F18]
MCEYVSRRVRSNLVNLLVEEFESKSELSKILGVSHAAVIDWLNSDGSHPSNRNLERIIKLALESDARGTLGELRGDLMYHRTLFEGIEDTYEG